jgi:cysteine synthase
VSEAGVPNPSGSISARIAKHMIEKREIEGLPRSGDTIAGVRLPDKVVNNNDAAAD